MNFWERVLFIAEIGKRGPIRNVPRYFANKSNSTKIVLLFVLERFLLILLLFLVCIYIYFHRKCSDKAMEIYLGEFCSPRSLDASRDLLHSARLHYAGNKLDLKRRWHGDGTQRLVIC